VPNISATEHKNSWLLSCNIFDIFDFEKKWDLQIWARGHSNHQNWYVRCDSLL